MMIAANQVAGLYAARHGLTVPFRYQEAPDVIAPEELDGKQHLTLTHGEPIFMALIGLD